MRLGTVLTLVYLAVSGCSGQSPATQAQADVAVSVTDGQLNLDDLVGKTINLPAWGAYAPSCPAGQTTLTRAHDEPAAHADVTIIRHANLDGDGALETAAVIECHQGVGNSALAVQIVAFDKIADGAIVVLGQLANLEKDVYAMELAARSQGGVIARVDVIVPAGVQTAPQLREFAWTGTGFAQVDGPKAFSGLVNTGGYLTLEDLLAAKVPVPSWGSSSSCPSGQIRLLARHSSGPQPDVTVEKVVHANFAGADISLGDMQTAVLLHCQVNQSGVTQVVVFKRDSAGQVMVMGQVVVSSEAPGQPQYMHEIQVGTQGRSLIVTVANDVTTDGTPTIRQDREYAWDGAKFVQVGGPTSF